MNNIKEYLIKYHELVCKNINENNDDEFIDYIYSLKEKELNSTVEISKTINNHFDKLLNQTSQKGGKTKKKKRGGAGMVALGIGAAIIYTIYNIIQNNYIRNRYRGRVPVEYQRLRPYPDNYVRRENFRRSLNTAPGYSDPHFQLYGDRYDNRNLMAEYYDSDIDFTRLDNAVDREERRDSDLMRTGADGFHDAVRRRDYLYRPGGEVERAAGRFMGPLVRRQAQQDYEDM